MGIETYSFPTTRILPTYIIQPCRESPSERNQHSYLLGPALNTTSFVLGRNNNKHGGINLHLKSDASGGIEIQGLCVENPYDAVGTVERDMEERIRSIRLGFAVTVTLAISEANHIVMRGLIVKKPTLVVNREILFHEAVAPQLQDTPADYFRGGRPGLTEHEFETLVDAVRENITAGRYFLIDK